MENENVKEEFGEVSLVGLWPIGDYYWNKKEAGFPLAVKGSKKKGIIKVEYNKNKGMLTKISRPYGLMSEYSIMPATRMPPEKAYFPKHIWNSIEFFLGGVIGLLWFFELKRKGWLTKNLLVKIYGSALDKITFLIGLSIPLMFFISLLYLTNIMYS